MIGPIFKGMATTLKHFFKPPVTIEYPDVKRPVRNRFKGRHHLERFDN
ncbi:MAG TPA: NADH-quinone oxidoreductase subunit I, partial [Anaerolineae bacterium]|nr:NADH-quinone oxidoreductase subunit I [Anaerolineae bacterium]